MQNSHEINFDTPLKITLSNLRRSMNRKLTKNYYQVNQQFIVLTIPNIKLEFRVSVGVYQVC